MTTNGVNTLQPGKVATLGGFTPEQIGIIKNTVAVGVSDGELALFLEVCRSSNLNPFKKQIYAVVRKNKRKDDHGNWIEESKMVIQTGIDGYRKTAANTGLHSGTSDPEYGPENAQGFPAWAKVTVKKLLPGGREGEFSATARWNEYVQTVKDYNTKAVGPNTQWAKMPYLMLGKCAEALALRKAFPDELSGIYTEEEMEQADSFQPEVQPTKTLAASGVTTGTMADQAANGWGIPELEAFADLSDRLYTAFKDAGRQDKQQAEADHWKERKAKEPASIVIPAMTARTEKLEAAAKAKTETPKEGAVEGSPDEADPAA